MMCNLYSQHSLYLNGMLPIARSTGPGGCFSFFYLLWWRNGAHLSVAVKNTKLRGRNQT
jgi:hypothetical protein